MRGVAGLALTICRRRCGILLLFFPRLAGWRGKQRFILAIEVLGLTGTSETLHFLAEDQADLDRWVNAFNPPKDDDNM